jgi:hypothetical protein
VANASHVNFVLVLSCDTELIRENFGDFIHASLCGEDRVILAIEHEDWETRDIRIVSGAVTNVSLLKDWVHRVSSHSEEPADSVGKLSENCMPCGLATLAIASDEDVRRSDSCVNLGLDDSSELLTGL